MVIVLRLIHVLGGVFWVGTFWFLTFFLFPIMGGVGPAAAPVMAGLQRRRFMTVLPIAALLTLASGIGLFWWHSGGAVGPYTATASGGTYATAGLLAIVAFLVGVLVSRPTAMAAGRLMQEMSGIAAGPEREALANRLAALQRRGVLANAVVAVLLTAATVGMTLARYM